MAQPKPKPLKPVKKVPMKVQRTALKAMPTPYRRTGRPRPKGPRAV